MERITHSSPSKTSEWIECESKKHIGKKFLFNKTTGESKWLSPKKKDENPVQVKKLLKAPANERLKRLQQKLRTDEKAKKNVIIKSPTKTSQTKNDAKVVTKKEKSPASSSSETKKTGLTPQERLKLKDQKVKTENDIKKPPEKSKIITRKPEKRKLELKKGEKEVNKQKVLKKESVKISKNFKIPKKTDAHLTKEKNIEYIRSHKTLKTTLIAQECLESFKDVETVKISAKSVKETHKNAATSYDSSVSETPELKFLTNMPNFNSTPISNLRRSANQRLERLRLKFEKENKDIDETSKNDKNSTVVTSSVGVTNIDLDCEAMDWEPSIENTTSCGFGSPAFQNETIQEPPTEMEVDDNLMLNAADKTFEATIHTKWRPTHLYIIVDTNILIHQLKFFEYLKNEKPTDAAGVILYLPYNVLQELDKLKLRENIKHQVQRAIRYLNKMFEKKDEHVQAQSALENRRRLIDIEVADDNILNCCLQVREHIPKLILLSEDVNLRNKAICNDISVFTKSDFVKNGLRTSQVL